MPALLLSGRQQLSPPRDCIDAQMREDKTITTPVGMAPIHACVCRRYDIDLRDDRELAYQRLKKFCMAGFVSVTDFRWVC
jgi:hypothetical protein